MSMTFSDWCIKNEIEYPLQNDWLEYNEEVHGE